MIYWQLITGFLQVGLFSFGGAYGAIALIRDVVLSYGWMDEEMLTGMIAVSESTPGPIMVNLATYVGSSQAGLAGAAVATAAVVMPSFVIILLVMKLLKAVLKNTHVQAVMKGLRPCMTGIILATGIYMVLRSFLIVNGGVSLNLFSALFTALLALLYFGSAEILKKPVTPIAFIIISAAAGMLLAYL